jgi:hypothetical protein
MERISITLIYNNTTIFNYKTKQIKRVSRNSKFRAITNVREPYRLRPRSK